MKKIVTLLSLAVLGLVLTACSSNEGKNKANDKLQVVTTFYPMYDFTKNIVGDKADVSMLITGGTEPHDYEPSAKDIARIQDADVFVYNSNEMETWVESVLANIDKKKTKVIEASDAIELMEGSESEEGEEAEHGHEHGLDPHVWLDPVLVKKEVAAISDGIIEVDEKNKATYEENTKNYQGQLSELDKTFKEAFKTAKNREFVTQHAAFGYLAKQYDLKQVSISGISPDQEPSPSELAKIEDFVKKNKVDYIYTEELASSKIAETIANATGAKMIDLNTLEGLSKDKQESGSDYISEMKENVKALQKTIK